MIWSSSCYTGLDWQRGNSSSFVLSWSPENVWLESFSDPKTVRQSQILAHSTHHVGVHRMSLGTLLTSCSDLFTSSFIWDQARCIRLETATDKTSWNSRVNIFSYWLVVDTTRIWEWIFLSLKLWNILWQCFYTFANSSSNYWWLEFTLHIMPYPAFAASHILDH